MFKFLKKPLAITQKNGILTPMKLTTQPQRNAINLFPSNPVHLASNLTGKTVRYENFHPKSNVADPSCRTFKIKAVEDVATSEATGSRYITAKVQDVDDGGTVKYRNLLLSGISIVV
jgi:hypothetical protein